MALLQVVAVITLWLTGTANTFVVLSTRQTNITAVESKVRYVVFAVYVHGSRLYDFYWMKDGKNISKEQTDIESGILRWNRLYLRIEYPNRQDAGTYTVVVNDSYEHDSLNVYLNVEYAPDVYVSSSKSSSKFYPTNVQHVIDCQVQSNPLPGTIDWFEQTCESPKNCRVYDKKWKPVNFTSTYPKQIILKGNCQTAGRKMIVKDTNEGALKFYLCRSSNTVGTSSQWIPYVATDIIDGFESWTLNKDAIDGDTVKMYFRANIWKYSNLTVMNRSHVTQFESEFAINKTDFIYTVMNQSHKTQVESGLTINRTDVTYISEKYSNTIILTISPVTSYDHEFVCFGYDVNGKMIKDEVGYITLFVRDAAPPTFLNDHKKVFFEDSFAYKCEVKGLPKPEVHWYKSSKKLDPNNSEEGYRISGDGQMLRINTTESTSDGLYMCVAENRAGSISRNFTLSKVQSQHSPVSLSWTTMIIIVCCGIIAAILVAMMFYFYIKTKRQSVKQPNRLEQVLMMRRHSPRQNQYTDC